MARYIDADHLDYRIKSEISISENGFAYAEAVEDRIKIEPTVDAVEVVRCKECCWQDTEGTDGDGGYYCRYHGFWYPPDYFCASGERRNSNERTEID